MNVINNQTSKDPTMMVLVRDLVLTLLQLNIMVHAEYINTKSNDLADSLSRLQLDRFHQLAPWAGEPVPIPEQYLPQNYSLTSNAY